MTPGQKNSLAGIWNDPRGLSTTEYLVVLLAVVLASALLWSLFSESASESTDEAALAIRTMQGLAGDAPSVEHWSTNSSVWGETGNTTFAGQTVGTSPSSNPAPSIELGTATHIRPPFREQPPAIAFVANQSRQEPATRTLSPSISWVDENGNPSALSDPSAPRNFNGADNTNEPILRFGEFTYHTLTSQDPFQSSVVDFSDPNSIYQNDNRELFQEFTDVGPITFLPEPSPTEPSFAKRAWDLYWEEQMKFNPIQTLALQGMWEAARDGTIDTINSIQWAANNKGSFGLNVVKAGLSVGLTPSETQTEQALNATETFVSNEVNHVADLTRHGLSGNETSFENLIEYFGGASYIGLTSVVAIDPSDMALAATLASSRAAQRGSNALSRTVRGKGPSTKVNNLDAPAITHGDAPASHIDESNPSNLDNHGNACRPDQCFATGTPVQTEHGPKPIEKIQIGDFVLARHEHTFELGYFEVVNTFSRDVPQVLRVIVQSEDKEEEIIVTQEHPFFTKEGWTPAKELLPGNDIITTDERTTTVLSLQNLVESTTVYNLTVQDAHTYFVGQTQMWVHNTCACTENDKDNASAVKVGPAGRDLTYSWEAEGRSRKLLKYYKPRNEWVKLSIDEQHETGINPSSAGSIWQEDLVRMDSTPDFFPETINTEHGGRVWEIAHPSYTVDIDEIFSQADLIRWDLGGAFHYHISFIPNIAYADEITNFAAQANEYLSLKDIAIAPDRVDSQLLGAYTNPSYVGINGKIRYNRYGELEGNHRAFKYFAFAIRGGQKIYGDPNRLGFEIRSVNFDLQEARKIVKMSTRFLENPLEETIQFGVRAPGYRITEVANVERIGHFGPVDGNWSAVRERIPENLQKFVMSISLENERTFDRYLMPIVKWEDRPFFPQRVKKKIAKERNKFLRRLKQIHQRCERLHQRYESHQDVERPKSEIEKAVHLWAKALQLHQYY